MWAVGSWDCVLCNTCALQLVKSMCHNEDPAQPNKLKIKCSQTLTSKFLETMFKMQLPKPSTSSDWFTRNQYFGKVLTPTKVTLMHHILINIVILLFLSFLWNKNSKEVNNPSKYVSCCPLCCVPLCAKLLQSCPILCDPMDCSPPESSVHRTLQARILDWIAMPSSRRSSRLRDRTRVSHVSCIGRWVLYQWRRLGSPLML